MREKPVRVAGLRTVAPELAQSLADFSHRKDIPPLRGCRKHPYGGRLPAAGLPSLRFPRALARSCFIGIPRASQRNHGPAVREGSMAAPAPVRSRRSDTCPLSNASVPSVSRNGPTSSGSRSRPTKAWSAWANRSGGEAVEAVIHEQAAPWLLGRDARRIEAISRHLSTPYLGFHQLRRRGAGGERGRSRAVGPRRQAPWHSGARGAGRGGAHRNPRLQHLRGLCLQHRRRGSPRRGRR